MGLILPQTVQIKWIGKTRKHYEKKGYVFTKNNNLFEVNVLDLTPSSTVKVLIQCDYCPASFEQKYRDYNRVLEKNIPKSCCQECKGKKNAESNMKRYGVTNPMKLPENQQKIQETNMERYGVTNTSGLDFVKEKRKQTNLDRYGVENPMQNEEIKNKLIQNVEEKYGVRSTLLVPEVRDKIIKTLMDRYGVNNPFKSSIIQEKIKNVVFERYGVEKILTSPEIRSKINATVLSRYGVSNVMQSDVIKSKFVENFLAKYGVENPLQVKEIREKYEDTMEEKYGGKIFSQIPELIEKTKATNLKKYGVEFYTLSPEMKEKARITMYENGSVTTSNQQRHIHSLIGGELNFPVENINLDIAYPEERIYLEYDGGGHNLTVTIGTLSQEEFDRKEFARSMFLRRKGWKEIRIISTKDKLPSNEKILEFVQIAKAALQNGRSWFEINFDNSVIRCSEFEMEVDFGYMTRLIKNKEIL